MLPATERISGDRYIFAQYDESVWPKSYLWNDIVVSRYSFVTDSKSTEDFIKPLVDHWRDSLFLQISSQDPSIGMFLFSFVGMEAVGHVARHKGLWGYLKGKSSELSALRPLCEIELSMPHCTRFTGIARVPFELIEVALRLVWTDLKTGIFLLPEDGNFKWEDMAHSLHEKAISKNTRYPDMLLWPDFVTEIVNHHGTAVRLFGPPDFGELCLDTFFLNS